jgi:hypothetical protein
MSDNGVQIISKKEILKKRTPRIELKGNSLTQQQ